MDSPLDLHTTPAYRQIQDGYDRMWRSGEPDLRGGQVDADPVPQTGSPRWGLSVVARLTPPVTVAMQRLIREIQPLAGDGHTFYDPSTLHVTVRSCEVYRPLPHLGDPLLQTYLDAVADVCAQYDPFEVAFRGVNANRVGIIAQGYPMSSTLQTLREALHGHLERRAAHTGPEADGVRTSAHASLAVFGGPLADAAALQRWLTAHREAWTGVTTVTELTVVHYVRYPNRVTIVPLGSHGLRT
ncbi:2'-5' RNA ligase family protein [uncultured Deinococcus sp.]|uniref:2'-5' RNA ligase family protein n=1 Tax=uncultured Deinococcus sp. TaxID=158789 RepID=UPI0025FC0CB4|nr:2'-5' RNA ligase family protein [uncultured Deinococcus sp.]